MSIKPSFKDYMNLARVMLAVVFEEFELVCICFFFFAIFSFYYDCQLVNFSENLGSCTPSLPRFLRACFSACFSFSQITSSLLCNQNNRINDA